MSFKKNGKSVSLGIVKISHDQTDTKTSEKSDVQDKKNDSSESKVKLEPRDD